MDSPIKDNLPFEAFEGKIIKLVSQQLAKLEKKTS